MATTVPEAVAGGFDNAGRRDILPIMSAEARTEPPLRRATREDGPAALELVTRVLREYGLQPDPEGTDSDLRDIEASYHARGGDFIVLAGADCALLGTCGLYPLGDGVVELRKMYLPQDLRGHGHGKRLLAWALRRARELGFRRMTLETATALKEAIALYERHGFIRDDSARHACRCDRSYSRNL